MVVASGVWWFWKSSDTKPAIQPVQPMVVSEPAKLLEPNATLSGEELELKKKLLLYFNTGNYFGALDHAIASSSLKTTGPEFNKWLQEQLPILYTSAGWLHVKTGRCEEGIKLFYMALKIGSVPEAKKGLGFCFKQIGNWPDAASWLSTYILESPADLESRIIYSDTLESLGRYEDAVKILEGTLYAAQTNKLSNEEMITKQLTAMRHKAAHGSEQKTEYSQHFFVSFRERIHDPLITLTFEILEQSLVEFEEKAAFKGPEHPIEVVLYDEAKISTYVPGGPGWAEGVFDGRIRVPVKQSAIANPNNSLKTILRHELVHALLASTLKSRRIPSWFEEGAAQWLSDPSKFSFGASPGGLLSISNLESPFISLNATSAAQAYQQSLYIIRLMAKRNGQDTIREIIENIPDSGALTSDDFVRPHYASFAEFYGETLQPSWKARL
jgi:tetratricopeptide (TPR) repeat protein